MSLSGKRVKKMSSPKAELIKYIAFQSLSVPSFDVRAIGSSIRTALLGIACFVFRHIYITKSRCQISVSLSPVFSIFVSTLKDATLVMVSLVKMSSSISPSRIRDLKSRNSIYGKFATRGLSVDLSSSSRFNYGSSPDASVQNIMSLSFSTLLKSLKAWQLKILSQSS